MLVIVAVIDRPVPEPGVGRLRAGPRPGAGVDGLRHGGPPNGDRRHPRRPGDRAAGFRCRRSVASPVLEEREQAHMRDVRGMSSPRSSWPRPSSSSSSLSPAGAFAIAAGCGGRSVAARKVLGRGGRGDRDRRARRLRHAVRDVPPSSSSRRAPIRSTLRKTASSSSSRSSSGRRPPSSSGSSILVAVRDRRVHRVAPASDARHRSRWPTPRRSPRRPDEHVPARPRSAASRAPGACLVGDHPRAHRGHRRVPRSAPWNPEPRRPCVGASAIGSRGWVPALGRHPRGRRTPTWRGVEA